MLCASLAKLKSNIQLAFEDTCRRQGLYLALPRGCAASLRLAVSAKLV